MPDNFCKYCSSCCNYKDILLTDNDIKCINDSNLKYTENIVFKYIAKRIHGNPNVRLMSIDEVTHFVETFDMARIKNDEHLIFVPFEVCGEWIMATFVCGQIYFFNFSHNEFNRECYDEDEDLSSSNYYDGDSRRIYISTRGPPLGPGSEMNYREVGPSVYTLKESKLYEIGKDVKFGDFYKKPYVKRTCDLFEIRKSQRKFSYYHKYLEVCANYFICKNNNIDVAYVDSTKITQIADSGVYICKMVDRLMNMKFYDIEKYFKRIRSIHEIFSLGFNSAKENILILKEFRNSVRETILCEKEEKSSSSTSSEETENKAETSTSEYSDEDSSWDESESYSDYDEESSYDEDEYYSGYLY